MWDRLAGVKCILPCDTILPSNLYRSPSILPDTTLPIATPNHLFEEPDVETEMCLNTHTFSPCYVSAFPPHLTSFFTPNGLPRHNWQGYRRVGTGRVLVTRSGTTVS